jgi:hypothetical protein
MFKLLGVCELWEFCVKIAKVARIIGILFYAVKFMYNFLLKNGKGYILGDFFRNASGHLVLGFL